MEPSKMDPALPAAPAPQAEPQAEPEPKSSKKRSRAETDASSPIEPPPHPTLPSPKPAQPRSIPDHPPLRVVKASASRSASLEPPSSVTEETSVYGGTSTSSLPDSTFSEGYAASASLSSLATAPRGSRSPPYMYPGSPRNPESPPGPTDDGEEEEQEDEEEDQEDPEVQAAAAQAEGSIIIDSDDLASDDGYGTDNNTSASTSLADSVRDYIFENGRRYHRFREGRYNFPNDDVECVASFPRPSVGGQSLTVWAGSSART